MIFGYTPLRTLNYRYADAKHYQYVGKYGYYDNEPDSDAALAGLLRLGVRFYDPQIGRFTQRDPAKIEVGVSWYVYARDNPGYYTDPRGLVPCKGACDKDTFSCVDCEIYLGGPAQCGGRCTLKEGKSRPSAIHTCVAQCRQALDHCGLEHCAEKTDQDGFMKCSKKVLDRIFKRYPWPW